MGDVREGPEERLILEHPPGSPVSGGGERRSPQTGKVVPVRSRTARLHTPGDGAWPETSRLVRH